MRTKTISVGQVLHNHYQNIVSNSDTNGSSFRRILRRAVLFALVALGCLVLLTSSINPYKFPLSSLMAINTSRLSQVVMCESIT
ncbi:hypothetical protein TorRG33x02_276730 [Trema orientale]|uniref:Uncharacterized protein n=1 Tax=Trema orientale TaxID=63057 RepID=A0A2P5CQD9_TREOI|nr:hypothetical protein TorRG33x02_276730 [Trema orientale]